MRLSTATITANNTIFTDPSTRMHLIEFHAPHLAQAVQPGQFCMVRCCHPSASDPLLRRPYFVHSVHREKGKCALLVHVRGRGSAWLASQQEGAELDILGPLGRGWNIRSTTRNLLLISENTQIAALTLLAQMALEQELEITLLCLTHRPDEAYPPALLSEEVEYHIINTNQFDAPGEYLSWADAAYCSVSRETALALYNRFERMRSKQFAQGVVIYPLSCGNGVCLSCSVEMRTGQKLVCRDGPVFDLRDIAR